MALTTDDQIEIDVHDDAAAMTHLFTLPAPARMDVLPSPKRNLESPPDPFGL